MPYQAYINNRRELRKEAALNVEERAISLRIALFLCPRSATKACFLKKSTASTS